MGNFDWGSSFGKSIGGFMNGMMGMPYKKPTFNIGGAPSAPRGPAAPLLGSLSSSYFKRPQAGLTGPGAVVGPPQAGLGNLDRGEASWTQRYGTAPKWSRLPQE